MAKKLGTVLTELTTAQLKRLLAARERIDVLETEKARLLKELANVDRELDRLVKTAAGAPAAGAKPGRKTAKKTTKKKAGKRTAKKPTRKKKVAKTAAKKTARRKTTARKAAGAKKTGRGKAAKKAARAKAPAGKRARVPLEDVIVAVLKKGGGSMSFKDLHTAIVSGKLYRSKAAKFENVLRRTLSTSKKVKRVGRGVYAPA